MINGINTSLQEVLEIKQEFREEVGIPNTFPFSAYPSYIRWQEDLGDIPTSPKYFDFTKNRYSKRGEPCGIREISEFIRLSSATDWVDGELVEVGKSVPRIGAGGLLIEPMRTNRIKNTNISSWYKSSGVTVEGGSGVVKAYASNVVSGADLLVAGDSYLGNSHITETEAAGSRRLISYFTPAGSIVAASTLSSWGSYPSISFVYDSTSGEVSREYRMPELRTTEQYGDYIRPIFEDSFAFTQYTRFKFGASLGNTIQGVAGYVGDGHFVTVGYPQFEITDGAPSSYIPTYGTPATRAPDILKVDILPNEYISGEWDEGIMFEQFNDYALFTGHGYIRNIEVLQLQGRPSL